MRKRDRYVWAAIFNLTWYCIVSLVLTANDKIVPDSLTVAWLPRGRQSLPCSPISRSKERTIEMKLQFNGKAYGMDGVYWCMQFVWWCFQQVDKSLFMDGGKTAPCGELMRWAQAHGQWVTTGYRPGDVLIYDFLGTSYKTDHCGICESVSGQYVTAIEGNTSNGNTGSQSNGDGVYRRKRKLSLLLGAYRPKYTDYRAQLQKRAGLEDKTMDYLAAYKYGADLIRKLATMKQFARFGQNSKGCVQRGHSLIHDNIFDNKTVPKHSETAQKFPLRPYLLRQNFGCWENEKTLKLQ